MQQKNVLFKQLTDTMEKNQENIIQFLEKKESLKKNDSSKENMIFFHEMLKPIKKEVNFFFFLSFMSHQKFLARRNPRIIYAVKKSLQHFAKQRTEKKVT